MGSVLTPSAKKGELKGKEGGRGVASIADNRSQQDSHAADIALPIIVVRLRKHLRVFLHLPKSNRMQLIRDPYLREVVWFAACCRMMTLLLQALFNVLIPDHAADAFFPPRLCKSGPWDQLVEGLLGGLTRWDAEHFLFIAEHGYLFEHNFAFFPLFPISVWGITQLVLWPLHGILCMRSRLVIVAVLLNGLSSSVAAAVLYRLGCVVLNCRKMAFLSALLFCLTPANVFLAAGYSESLFALLAFSAMWQLESGHIWASCLLFSLATGLRSNGVINTGFILYSQFRHLALFLCVSHKPLLRVVLRVSITVLLAFAVILPFALFQYYAFMTFCNPNRSLEDIAKPLLQLALDKGYRLADVNGAVPEWCFFRYPLIYSYIQDVYWKVGFLRYFEARQIPNFLLAVPVIILTGCAAWMYGTADPWYCASLGLLKKKSENLASAKTMTGFHSPRLFVYVVHNSAQLLFGLFYMHVQVLTRFLGSSSPVLYWFAAHLLQNEPMLWGNGLGEFDDDSSGGSVEGKPTLSSPHRPVLVKNPLLNLLRRWRHCTILSKALMSYFLAYWLLGLILFCNFLPWT